MLFPSIHYKPGGTCASLEVVGNEGQTPDSGVINRKVTVAKCSEPVRRKPATEAKAVCR